MWRRVSLEGCQQQVCHGCASCACSRSGRGERERSAGDAHKQSAGLVGAAEGPVKPAERTDPTLKATQDKRQDSQAPPMLVTLCSESAQKPHGAGSAGPHAARLLAP